MRDDLASSSVAAKPIAVRPTPDRRSIALGHRQIVELLDGKKPDFLVLVARRYLLGRDISTSVGHDDDLDLAANVVEPAIEDGLDDDRETDLLANLANHACGRVLTRLELAAGELPFVAFVAQENDPVPEPNDG